MQAQITVADRMRTTTIRPFKEPYKTIIVSQVKMMGTGKWGRAHIKWGQEMDATAEQLEQFITALQEAVRRYKKQAKEYRDYADPMGQSSPLFRCVDSPAVSNKPNLILVDCCTV